MDLVCDVVSSTDNRMPIRVLVADDDDFVLRCYQRSFAQASTASGDTLLDSLSAELFASGEAKPSTPQPSFDLVACSQGEDAVARVIDAKERHEPFDVVVLDIRMPPGINGVEAGERIRELEPCAPIVFVSGYSDVARQELEQRIPPSSKLHYFSKPLSFSDLANEITRIVYESRNAQVQ